MKKLAFIDPFVVSPAVHCFNGIVELLNLTTSYHMPSKYGTEGLEAAEADAYLIVGSASHVTDPLEWHGPLAQFLVKELRAGKPVMGCCFGHQLLCHVLGSTVEFAHPDQEKYAGTREIVLKESFWNFKQGEVFRLPVTHRQVVTSLGPDLLSVGVGLPNDMVIHKTLPLLTTQAHPEASMYFCQSDIQGLDSAEGSLARRDGQQLIQRFFARFISSAR